MSETRVAVAEENKIDETPVIETPVTDVTLNGASEIPDVTSNGASDIPAPAAAKPMRILKEGDAANEGETLYTVTDGKVVGPDGQELEDGSLKTEILALIAAQEGGRRRSRRNRRQSKKRQQKRQSKKQNGGKKRNSKRNQKK